MTWRNNCSEYFSSRLKGTDYVRRRFWMTNFRWEEGLFGSIEAATEFDAASYFDALTKAYGSCPQQHEAWL